MPLPRGLLVCTMLWVVAAFAVTIGTHAPIQPTSGVYTPAVQAMLELLAAGGCLLWPAARLTTAHAPWHPARAALDTVTVLVAFHAIFWPLHRVTHWTLAQAWTIDAMLSGWIAAAGACIALALRNGRRTAIWCSGWLALSGAGAVLDAAGMRAPVPDLLGPFAAVLRLAPIGPAATDPGTAAIAAWPWILAFCGWASALRPRSAPSGVAPTGMLR